MTDTHLPFAAHFYEDHLALKLKQNTPVDELIEYNANNKNICIDCIDLCFDELKKLPGKKLITELAQSELGRSIALHGNIYTLYCYFELLKSFSAADLGRLLTTANQDRKTIGYYLLAARKEEIPFIKDYIAKNCMGLLQKLNPETRSMVLLFKSTKNYQVLDELIDHIKNNAQALCDYLVLAGSDKTVLPKDIHRRSQQLVFEYIDSIMERREQKKLIDLALSPESALNAFITFIPNRCIHQFLMHPGLQYLQPYIWRLAELKKGNEKQSPSLISGAMRFFLPEPLNTRSLDKAHLTPPMP